MFCPKCGIENPDNGKFCRSCGANLINVLAVVNGKFELENKSAVTDSYSEIYTAGIRNTILGMGFFVTSIFVKTMPGDTFLWLAFMIPAFILTASGVTKILKSEAMKNERKIKATIIQTPTLPQTQPISALPPTSTDYVSPIGKSYTTDNLAVPSVTEETTQHLKMISENETNALK